MKDRPIYAPLSELERVLAQEALQKALESVASQRLYRWENHDSGISGFVTPLRTFKIQTGHYCRQFMEAVAKQDLKPELENYVSWIKNRVPDVEEAADALRAYNELLNHELARLYRDWFKKTPPDPSKILARPPL